MPINVNEDNWDAVVEQSILPTLLKIGASWCGPCKVQEHFIAQIEPDLVGRLQVVYVDVDVSPGIAAKFGIRSVPALFVIDKGRVVSAHSAGVLDADRLLTFVAPW